MPVVNGKSLHSRYDPAAEARKLVADKIAQKPSARIALVLGMGFAYHIEALREALPPSASITVFEPLSEIVSSYASAVGKNIDNVRLWPSPTPQDVVDAVAGVVSPSLINQVLIFAHPPSVELDPPAYQSILAAIQSAIDQIAMSLTTGWGFGFEWIENALRNIRRLPDLPVLAQFTSAVKHPPAAVILGAGPSIDEDWDLIRKAETLKFAVDTVLEPMAHQDITPHLAFLFDSQIENARLVEAVDASRINLAVTLEVHPSVFERSWNNLFVASCDDGVLSWIEKRIGVSAGSVKQGGSVATGAFDCARGLGCPAIYLAGVDLSFSAREVYCRRTAYERRALESSERFHPPEGSLYEMKRERTERKVSGRLTQENMFNYFRWLKDEIGRTAVPVTLLRNAGLLAEIIPSDGSSRISSERYPAGFDPARLGKKFPANSIFTRETVDRATAEIRRGLEVFLHADHFADPDALDRALENSGLSDILAVVVEPPIAVCRYERDKGLPVGPWLEELRDRLGRLAGTILFE